MPRHATTGSVCDGFGPMPYGGPRGDLSAVRLGRRIVIPRVALEQLLNETTRPLTGPT